jgi:hypothetical protein
VDAPTIAEVARRVDDVVTRFDRVITAFETQYVRFDVFVGYKEQASQANTAQDDRIRKLEDRQEWLVRTVGAIVLAAILGVVYTLGGGA